MNNQEVAEDNLDKWTTINDELLKARGRSGVILACLAHMKVPSITEQIEAIMLCQKVIEL